MIKTFHDRKDMQIQLPGADQRQDMARLFHVLSDPTRLHILYLLLDKDELCVSEVNEATETSMSGTSQQLRRLEQHGLITRQRSGQKMCYFPNRSNAQAAFVFRCLETLKQEDENA